MTDPRESLSEEEARATWERAMEMQSRAAAQAEEEAAALVLGGTTVAPHEGGYRVEDVTAAAAEAGIAPEFMRLALAELAVTQEDRAKNQGRVGKGIDWWIRDDRLSLEVSRVIDATPERVLAAMQRIFPRTPYSLTLEDSIGGDALDEGVLVFRAPGTHMVATSPTAFGMAMLYGTVRKLLVTVRAVDENRSRTRITVRAPLHAHRRENYWLGLGSGAVLGAIGGGGGFALGAATVGAAVGAAALAVPLAGLVAGLALGSSGAVWTARWSFGYGIKKAEKGLEGLIQALDVHIRVGGQFDAPSSPAAETADEDRTHGFLVP